MISGIAYYNGFYFPSALESSVTSEAVPGESGRSVKSYRHTITLEFVVYPGVDDHDDLKNIDGSTYQPIFPSGLTDIHSAMDSLRKKLLVWAKPIAFEKNTFSNRYRVAANQTEAGGLGIVDVGGGPKPQTMTWSRIAGDKAARVTWVCVVETTECETLGNPTSRIGDFSYSMTWNIDERGITSRTISGTLSVFAPREGKQITDNADMYREDIQFELPGGFKRASQTYQLSADRTTLSFEINDVELESDNPYYPGVVNANVRVQFANSNRSPAVDASTTHWDLTISGTIEVAKGVHRCFAWLAFAAIVRGRVNAAKADARVQATDDINLETKTGAGIKMAYGISIEEDVFGRSMTFVVSYMLVASMRTVLQASGMWTPIPGADWNQWKTSLTDTYDAWKERGHANLQYLPSEDVLVSFCDPQQPEAVGQATIPTMPQAPVCDFLENECPDAKDSWIQFRVQANLIEDTYSAYHKPLKQRQSDNFGSTINKFTEGLNIPQSDAGNNAPIRQSRSTSQYRVHYSGYAMRLGHKIPRPLLLQYGGQVARPVGELRFQQNARETYEGCPLYHATWSGEYVLDGPPQSDEKLIEPDPRNIVQ